MKGDILPLTIINPSYVYTWLAQNRKFKGHSHNKNITSGQIRESVCSIALTSDNITDQNLLTVRRVEITCHDSLKLNSEVRHALLGDEKLSN